MSEDIPEHHSTDERKQIKKKKRKENQTKPNQTKQTSKETKNKLKKIKRSLFKGKNKAYSTRPSPAMLSW